MGKTIQKPKPRPKPGKGDSPDQPIRIPAKPGGPKGH